MSWMLILLAGCYSQSLVPLDDDDAVVIDDDDASRDDDDATRPAPDDDDATAADDDDTAPDDDDTAPDDDDSTPSPDDDDATPTGGPWCYSEFVDPSASVSDLQASYSSWSWLPTLIEVFERRHPSTAALLTEMQYDPWLASFVDPSSWTTLMDGVGTAVHEETHGWDYENALFYQHFGYWIRDDWSPQIPFHQAFPRSEILPLLTDTSTAMYADTYLLGTQGTYGYMELLDELNAYINGMAADAMIGEFIPWGVSSRDGPLALMHFLQLYLRQARTAHPTTYNAICDDPQMVDLLLVQWHRMNFFLDWSDLHPALGINDAAIEAHTFAPANVDELEWCTGHTLQTSPCLLPGDPWTPPY